ncbi:MAG TPA: zinc ribbon domain-containing protein [Anaerolineales bacterium]
MRACPHCSREIQDEAVFCRHCRRDVEPALWLTAMRRCPYCAEWIDLEVSKCNHCQKVLGTGPERTAPFVESSLDDLVGDLRREAGPGPRDDLGRGGSSWEAEPEPASRGLLGRGREPQPEPVPARDQGRGRKREPEPVPARDLGRAGRSWEADLEQQTAASAQPQARKLGPFRRRPREPKPEPQYQRPEPLFVGTSGIEEVRPPAPDEDPSSFAALPIGRRRETSSFPQADREALISEEGAPSGRGRRMLAALARTLIGLVLLGSAGFGGFYLLRGPGAPLLAQLLATATPPAPTDSPAPTNTLSRAPTLPPVAGSTPIAADLTTTPGGQGCLSWEEVTLADEGKQLCVFGVIRRWFAVDEVPFVAIFSEDVGTFALVDRTGVHPVGPGDCVQGTGVVEVMRGTRPNIDVQGNLQPCTPE